MSFNYFVGGDADVQFHVFWIRDMVVQVEILDVYSYASGIESVNDNFQKAFCYCDCCSWGAQNFASV